MKLLAMSGFVPEQICDIVRFSQYGGERNIPHYCGYAADYISQVLHDPSINGAVFPKSCDSARIISSYLSGSGKFTYQLNVPARRDSLAIEYYANSIRRYQAAVERYDPIEVQAVRHRAELVNKRNDALRELYRQIGSISFSEYLRGLHEMLKEPLEQQTVRTDFAGRRETRKRVFLIGSFLSNVDVVQSIEESGMTIVGDTLPESGRMLSAPPVNLNGDIYSEIAASVLSGKPSPTQDAFGDIIRADLEEIKRTNAVGVIFVLQQYCEPYHYLYYAYKDALESCGIPALKITVSNTQDDPAALSIEAFADILS